MTGDYRKTINRPTHGTYEVNSRSQPDLKAQGEDTLSLPENAKGMQGLTSGRTRREGMVSRLRTSSASENNAQCVSNASSDGHADPLLKLHRFMNRSISADDSTLNVISDLTSNVTLVATPPLTPGIHHTEAVHVAPIRFADSIVTHVDHDGSSINEKSKTRVETYLKEKKIFTPSIMKSIERELRRMPATINIPTNRLFDFLEGGATYTNVWNRPVENNVNSVSYNTDRDAVERALHGLPPMEVTKNSGNAGGLYIADNQIKFIEASFRAQSPELCEQIVNEVSEQLALPENQKSADKTAIASHLKSMPAMSLATGLVDDYVNARIVKRKFDLLKQVVGKTQVLNVSPGPDSRPISVATGLNGRLGNAPAYGHSHIVLKDEVKDRATITSTDSINSIFRKSIPASELGDMGAAELEKGILDARRKVGTFENPWVALAGSLYGEQPLGDTLATDPAQVPKAAAQSNMARWLVPLSQDPTFHPRKAGQNQIANDIAYFEMQVFGGINPKDISKIVVDQSDLEAISQGKDVSYAIDTNTHAYKSVLQMKSILEAFSKQYGFDIQYVRGTGGSPRGPQEIYHNEARYPIEALAEKVLLGLRGENFENVKYEAGSMELVAKDAPWKKKFQSTQKNGLSRHQTNSLLEGTHPELTPLVIAFSTLSMQVARQQLQPSLIADHANALLKAFYAIALTPQLAQQAEKLMYLGAKMLSEAQH